MYGRRVVAVALLSPLVFVLASPGGTPAEKVGFRLGERYLQATLQLSAIDAGRYLTNLRGESITADAREDIGRPLLLADLALLRNGLGLGPMTPDTLHHLGAIVAVLVVAVLVLVGTRPLEVAMALAVIALYMPSVAGLRGERTWPQVLAVILALVLMTRTSRPPRGPGAGKTGFGAVFSLAFVAGLMGHLRSEATYIVLLPFLALFGVHALALAISWLPRVRATLGPSRAPEFSGELPLALRSALMQAVVIAAVLGTSLAVGLNLRLFEWLEGVEHRPEMGRHLFWHPLYVGLGYNAHTQENLSWNDAAGQIEAHRTNGFFGDFGRESEAAVRHRYLEIAYRNTPFFVDVYQEKGRDLFGAAAPEIAFRVEPLLVVICVLGALFAVSAVRGGAPALAPGFPIGALLVVLTAALPGLVGGTRHAVALNAALAGCLLFGAAALVETALRGSAPSEADVRHRRSLQRSLVAIGLALAVVVLVVFGRMTSIRWHRAELTASLASGDMSFDRLVEEYPVDAVLAFNRLSPADKGAQLDALLAAGSERLPAGVAQLRPGLPPEILYAHWTDETLYLMVRLDKPIGPPRGIPVRLEIRESELTIPRSGLAIFLAGENDVIHVQRGTSVGVWLYALRAPRATVEACVVGPMVSFSKTLYTTRLERLLGSGPP